MSDRKERIENLNKHLKTLGADELDELQSACDTLKRSYYESYRLDYTAGPYIARLTGEAH